MRNLVPFFACAALMAQSDEVRNPRTSPSDVAAGAKTFRSHCAECHGLNGEGGRGPNLATGEFFHGSSDAELLRNISDGIPGTEMPGLFYSPDRVWQVVAYLRSLSAESRGRPGGDRENGARLFAQKNCGQCHRVNGQGGRMGPDLSDIGRSRAAEHLGQALLDPNADVRQRYWLVTAKPRTGAAVQGFLLNEDTYTVQLIDFQDRLHSIARREMSSVEIDKKASKMPSYKGQLKDSEVRDLVSYLASLRSRGGAQ